MGHRFILLKHHMVITTLLMCIPAKSPKASEVSANVYYGDYELMSIGIVGAFIPYGGTEKKVKVCVILSPSIAGL